MSNIPLFTQKHYEYLTRALQTVTSDDARITTACFLCHVFEMDNPKFKPSKFLRDARPNADLQGNHVNAREP